MTKTDKGIYQIKITLKYSKPPIWRRLLISSETTLVDLHDIIQVAMGWEDSHLHMFRIENENYTLPYDKDHLSELGALDSRRVKLGQLITSEGAKFTYEYDFGDSWEHEILIERILPPVPGQPLPVCVTGKRACPPEDVGGIWGYADFLEAMKDPQHPEHEMYADWFEGEFAPEAFDVDAVNSALRGGK